jgi:pimeloyl-ACP methyl ester carboxylesterase
VRERTPVLAPGGLPVPTRILLPVLCTVLALVSALAGCSGPADDDHGSQTAGSGAPAQTTGGFPDRAPDHQTSAGSTQRPVEPIPDVRPEGMVDPPPGDGLNRYLDQDVSWQDCGENADKQCATVLAPLDYDDPDQTAITLALARRISKADNPQGAMFINPGGPGGSGVDYVNFFNPHGLDQAYDIVGWDPRGVGRSTPVHCLNAEQMEHFTTFDYSPDNEQETEALIDLNAEFGAACLRNSGALLEHVSTEDTVRDLELLRQLLGQQRLNYFGSSYGSSIGAMYATMFGSTVGRMVLDGPTSIGSEPDISQTQGFDRTLGNFARWCAAQGCRLGEDKIQVLETIGGFLTRLDADPIPGGRRDLNQALATSGLIYALYSPAADWPRLRMSLELAILAGDGRLLLAAADRLNQRDRSGEFGQFNAAFPAIRCLGSTDEGVKGELAQWQQLARKAPTIGPFAGPDLACATWPVASTGELKRTISYTGEPVVLLIGTAGDPATPYEYAEQMRNALESSRLITLRGNGHLGFDQSECVQQAVYRYAVQQRAPQSDSTCG